MVRQNLRDSTLITNSSVTIASNVMLSKRRACFESQLAGKSQSYEKVVYCSLITLLLFLSLVEYPGASISPFGRPSVQWKLPALANGICFLDASRFTSSLKRLEYEPSVRHASSKTVTPIVQCDLVFELMHVLGCMKRAEHHPLNIVSLNLVLGAAVVIAP